MVSACTSVPKRNNESPSDLLLRQCDLALEGCNKANEDKANLIKKQNELLNSQSERISDLEKTQPSKTLWFILGAVFTGLVTFLVKK